MTNSKKDNDEISFRDGIIVGCVCIAFACVIIECVLFGISYFYADRVECNWLWCSFITERQETITQMTSSRTCSVNGVMIDCEEFDKEYEDYARHNWNNVNGVCPGINDNLSIKECIRMAEQK